MKLFFKKLALFIICIFFQDQLLSKDNVSLTKNDDHQIIYSDTCRTNFSSEDQSLENSELPSNTPQTDERLFSKKEFFELFLDAQKKEDEYETSEIKSTPTKKPFTFMVYMAADNDLHLFAYKNIKQMEAIGSNENCNIVVQLNTPGRQTPTKRYVVKQGKRLLVQHAASPNIKLDSGDPKTLVDFVQWSATHYPAEEYALILWNHGSGSTDPGGSFTKVINPCDLFYNNPSDNKLELDRGISYISLLYAAEQYISRGICFDETFKSYISNPELEGALHEICTNVLGQKLAIVAFDACLMAMIEIASAAQKYAKYMVGSQDIEYGTGWNYEFVLKPFLNKALSPKELAQQIVKAYQQAYQSYINDYTQSALDLTLCQQLEDNIHNVAGLLIEALSEKQSGNIRNILRKCKSTQHCTCFEEPSYIDCKHFYKNILQHLSYFTLNNKQKEQQIQSGLKTELTKGLAIIDKMVVANTTGSKLKGASGVSIYFPEYGLSQSYLKASFGLKNLWGKLLIQYIFG